MVLIASYFTEDQLIANVMIFMITVIVDCKKKLNLKNENLIKISR